MARGMGEPLLHYVMAYREQRAGGEGVDPVLVPEQVQEMRVEGGLEVRHLQGVVLPTVHTKILNLLQGDGLVLPWAVIRRGIPLGGQGKS